MKNQEHQQDKFLRSLFKESEVVKDLGITEHVMHQIQEGPSQLGVKYQPPISKTAWVIIAVIFSCSMIYAALLESTFTLQMPDYAFNLSSIFIQLKNSFSLNVSLPELPSLSIPYLAVILVFNIAGMYFMWSYRRSGRA